MVPTFPFFGFGIISLLNNTFDFLMKPSGLKMAFVTIKSFWNGFDSLCLWRNLSMPPKFQIYWHNIVHNFHYDHFNSLHICRGIPSFTSYIAHLCLLFFPSVCLKVYQFYLLKEPDHGFIDFLYWFLFDSILIYLLEFYFLNFSFFQFLYMKGHWFKLWAYFSGRSSLAFSSLYQTFNIYTKWGSPERQNQ